MDSRLEKLQELVRESLASTFGEELSWHAPGKWCAAEIFEHLYLTYTGTTKGFERVAAAGKSLATSATWPQRLRTLVVVGFGHMPQGVTAPAVARPRGLPLEKVRTEIIAAIQQMDEVITRCEATFGDNAKLLDHPILGPLTAAQWRKLHLVHGQHHVKQVWRLCQAGKMDA
jgi:Protein of unknown function (DUF1569)